jgi:alkanesulfonate monooxygenase
MTEFHWFLPTLGDGRNVVNSLKIVAGAESARGKGRKADPYYLLQLARAAESAGFKGALLPTALNHDDTFVAAASIAHETRSLEYIIAFRAGLTLPSIVAQMTGTLQRSTGGRIRINITTGGNPGEQRAYGDFLDHDDRYRRTDEFLEVLEHFWRGQPFSHKGSFYQNELLTPIDFGARPPTYFTGSSEIAKDIAARHADAYLMYGEPPPVIKTRVAEMRERASHYGRHLRFGIFIHVIARDTEGEAFAEAERHLEAMDPKSIAAVQQNIAAMDSVGQARQTYLHGGNAGSVRSLLVYPNLWAGVGLIRGGGGTALLGSYAQVAERIEEYVDAGLDILIMNGYPALEEAYRVGELVLPLVRQGSPAAPQAAPSQTGTR